MILLCIAHSRVLLCIFFFLSKCMCKNVGFVRQLTKILAKVLNLYMLIHIYLCVLNPVSANRIENIEARQSSLSD